MRDRLVELLKNIEFDYCEECVCAAEDGYKSATDFAKFFADRLLANGVIVPPCKVGDTIYYISGFCGYEKICGKKVKRIWFDNEGLVFTVSGMYMDFNIPDNEMYITREEAEKALKEVKG